MHETARPGWILVGAALALVTTLDAAAAEGPNTGRIVEYYRRKNNLAPAVSATITDIRDSEIPGAKRATIETTKEDQTQRTSILLSADGRYVVFGEVEDVTRDPFAEIVKKIDLTAQPVRGGKNAPVTIVEYSDFQCPYCARAHSTVARQVMREYGEKVRLVHKNYPLGFHKWAEPAAIAVECALEQSDEAFWQLYDFYFTHQREITPDNVKDKMLEGLKGAKIDEGKLVECYDGKRTLGRVQADLAEGQSIGVSGTPAFFINGRKLSGAQPFENFKAVIDDELQRAEKQG
jgi:protein-disulfide isomerase